MKRSEIKELVVFCIENMDDMSDSDATSVQSYAKTLREVGNLAFTAVEHVQRIVGRIKRKQAGLSAPKPTN